ncbi:MAG: bifunctional acetate--CoA ligase family protein/GNAT family N-acetyltransferase [Aliivibrio sp.]|uniref:bifunctional acetate--CoA ligase family protein/GNAT family N-acetyltransferase n=1 Tax=Aliivibrio sp. TaxID=1872443 RepID=UPI001A3B2B60|nr:bifunctional acetate--CoA ligase family protein/GNAT family N-acetyltransferase [Aliivibrio sp.]
MQTLDKLLKPTSVAVIGASDTEYRAGNIIMRNLLSAGFDGPIIPVTPKYHSVRGVLAYSSVADMPIIPDLAVLCTNAARNSLLLKELGQKGVKAAILLSSEMSIVIDDHQETMLSKCKVIAAKYGIRLLGPNSLGIILPWLNLNASFSPVTALKGNIAFVSQSAAVCTTILDWANDKQIGFSSLISLGDTADIDFAELLDTLCTDSKTNAILLYIDSITDARKFMSAARAASRNRRILVLKSGNSTRGRESAVRHSQGAFSLDVVYDSAIRRAGMLRVPNTHELFAAVETLAHSVPLRGERLAIMSNGHGPATMAVDTLMQRGGKLATLLPETIESLNLILPKSWSKENPINLLGDASVERYCQVLEILLSDGNFDALLIMHCPSAISPAKEAANRIIEVITKHPKGKHYNILTNWSGEKSAKSARLLFTKAGFPTYRTPESSVAAFAHLVEYRRNQKQLMETPTSTGQISKVDKEQAHQWIKKRVVQGTNQLDTHQLQTLFRFYGFSALETWIALDTSEATHIAENIGYPVAVKLRSPDIPYKSDVQGVMLSLNSAQEVASGAQAILDRVNISYPAARIDGLVIQSMANRAGAQELRVKVNTDPIFGPVILLGEGGSEWDDNRDAAVAIPPLNMALARYLVMNAIKSGKIRNQNRPDKMNIDELSSFLVRLSQMIIDCPEIVELDINPLLVSGSELTIIDAALTLEPFEGNSHQRLAIRPYPDELEQWVNLKDGSDVLLRPILPEDEPKHADFISKVSVDDLYKRFFSDVGELNHEALANLTQIDYDREMAFVATITTGGDEKIIAVARAVADPENIDAEFAILVRSDLKGQGLGRILMSKIIEYCRGHGTKTLSGMTMPNNRGMILLAQKLGFDIDIQMEDGVVDMLLHL